MKEVGRRGDLILMGAETEEEKEYFGEKIYSINIYQRRKPSFMQDFYRWRDAKRLRKWKKQFEKELLIKAMEACSLPNEIKELFCWCQVHKSKKTRITRETSPVSINDDILPEWHLKQRIRPGKLINMILKSYT